MKTLVCISNVPDTTTKVTFTSDNTQFNTSGVQYIINPYDEIALSRALELSEGGKGTVTVIHVGNQSAEPTLRKALAIGADDAVRINAEPADGLFVARQLAAFIKDKGYDLILSGKESIDYNGGQVPVFLSGLLNIPVVTAIKKLDIEAAGKVLVTREIEGGKEIISAGFPLILSCAEGVAEPKIPNMRGIMSARTKPLQVIEATEAPVQTRIVEFKTPAQRGKVKLFTPEEAPELVKALHSEAKVI